MDESGSVGVHLRVEIAEADFEKLGIQYSNHVTVRVMPDDTYLAFYLRKDHEAKIEGGEFISKAEPVAVVVVPNNHALKIAELIQKQHELVSKPTDT